MPRLKSAKKKLRQDKKRTIVNLKYKEAYKKAIKKLKKDKKSISSKEIYSKIDKAVKKGVIHKNKADRLKSIVSKLLSKTK